MTRLLLLLGLFVIGGQLLCNGVAVAVEPNQARLNAEPQLSFGNVQLSAKPQLSSGNKLGITLTSYVYIPLSTVNDYDTPKVKWERALAADEEPRQYTAVGTLSLRSDHNWETNSATGVAWTRLQIADSSVPSGDLLYRCTFWDDVEGSQNEPLVSELLPTRLASAPMAVPTGLQITDNHVASNEVVLNWNAVTGTAAELGYSQVTGYAIGRREFGRTHVQVIGSIRGANNTEYRDGGPVAGVVEYAVLPTTEYTSLYTDWQAKLIEVRGWVPIEFKITPLDLRPPTGLSIDRVENDDQDWLLTWNQLPEDRRYRPFHFQVWQRIEGGAFTQIDTVRAVPRPDPNYRIVTPAQGQRHEFHVIAARDAVDFNADASAPSQSVTFGTEAAPTVWEGDKGPGQVTIRWEPGNYNGNTTAQDGIRWFLQYWPTSLTDPNRRTTVRAFGDANTRAFVLRYHATQWGGGGSQPAQDFIVRVAAMNRAGVGVAAELTTSPIASNRAPQDPGKGAVRPQMGQENSSRIINWWIEGPAVLSPGDRAVYTLHGEYADNSGDPLAGRDRYLIRPVGVREPVANDRGVYDLTNDADGCHAVGTTDGHKVCLATVTVERSEANVPIGPRLVQYRPPRTDSAGSLAYRVDADGVPAGHEMQVEIRDVAPISFFGETFQVGIGVRGANSSLLLEARHYYLDVTVERAAPLPPAGLQLTTATGDPTMWRLDWLPPVNRRAADVDAYRVYRRQHGTGEFAQPTDTEYTVLWAEVPKADDPMLEEFHVVAINAADAMSAPSAVVRTGLPYPPRDVAVNVVPPPAPAVVLSWVPPSAQAGATGTTYRVETAVQEAGPWRVLTPATNQTTRRYTAAAVPPEETMYYRIRAVNTHGASAASKVVHAQLPGDPPRRLLTASAADGSSVTLSWLRPRGLQHTPVVGYRVERQSAGDMHWTELEANTGDTRTVYVDNSPVGGGGHYRVTVRTASGLGASVSSNAASPTTFDYRMADINKDGVIDVDDAAVLFYALAHRTILGDGTGRGGWFAGLRRQLLASYRGTLGDSDAGYEELVGNAWDWQRAALENGGDLNQDSVVDTADALILHYAHGAATSLGMGASDSGTGALRRAFLGPLAGPFGGDDDAVLRGMIMQARALLLAP